MSSCQLPTLSHQPFAFGVPKLNTTTLRNHKSRLNLIENSLHHRQSPCVAGFTPLPSTRNAYLCAVSIDQQTSHILSHTVFSFPFELFNLLWRPLIDILHLRKRTTFQTQPNMHGLTAIYLTHDGSNTFVLSKIKTVPKGQPLHRVWITSHFCHLCWKYAVRRTGHLKQNWATIWYKLLKRLWTTTLSCKIEPLPLRFLQFRQLPVTA